MKVDKRLAERTVTTTVTEPVYTLELTEEEARMLVAVTGRCIGFAENDDVRAVTTPIYYYLAKLGIDYFSPEVQKYVRNIKTGLVVAPHED